LPLRYFCIDHPDTDPKRLRPLEADFGGAFPGAKEIYRQETPADTVGEPRRDSGSIQAVVAGHVDREISDLAVYRDLED